MIEIKITAESVSEMHSQLADLLRGNGAPAQTSKPEEVKGPEKKIVEKTKTQDKPKNEKATTSDKPKTEEKTKATTTVKKEEKKEESSGDIKLDDIRPLMASKISAHRDAIKEALTELGATSISTIKEGDYAKYYEFLKSLD